MEQQVNTQVQTPLIKPIGKPKGKSKKNIYMILISLVVVVLGVATGWFLSGGMKKSVDKVVVGNVSKDIVTGGSVSDCQFDTTEGDLKSGGIDGEGTHHLEKEGGESQNVYLTSTVLDLESFVGKKVKVCGETIAGKKAGWLMDVTAIQQI